MQKESSGTPSIDDSATLARRFAGLHRVLVRGRLAAPGPRNEDKYQLRLLSLVMSRMLGTNFSWRRIQSIWDEYPTHQSQDYGM